MLPMPSLAPRDPSGWIPPRLECFLVLAAAWAAVLVASAALLSFSGWHPAPATGGHTPAGFGLVVAGTLANELAVAVVLGGYLWLRRSHRGLLLPLGAPTARGVSGTLLAVLGAVPWADLVGTQVERWMGRRSDAMQIVLSAVSGAGVPRMLLLAFALAIVPALVEEALFRGVITAGFQRSRLEAIVLPSLFFGAFHLEPQQAAATTVLGIAFGLGRVYTGSLSPSMVVHAAYNAGVLVMMRWVGPAADSRVSWVLLALGGSSFALGLWLLTADQRGHGPPPADASRP